MHRLCLGLGRPKLPRTATDPMCHSLVLASLFIRSSIVRNAATSFVIAGHLFNILPFGFYINVKICNAVSSVFMSSALFSKINILKFPSWGGGGILLIFATVFDKSFTLGEYSWSLPYGIVYYTYVGLFSSW